MQFKVRFCLSGEKYFKWLLWTSLPHILNYIKFLKLTTLMDFRAMQIDFRYKSNLTWKIVSFSSQCIRMGDKPGSAAGYNYSLSQNEVLFVLKGHQRVAAIKYSTRATCLPISAFMLLLFLLFSSKKKSTKRYLEEIEQINISFPPCCSIFQCKFI